MSVGTPDSSTQVVDRIKVDIQRSAPDSDPFLRVQWLGSFATAVGMRQFDFYLDLTRTESRLFPDTADDETAPRWGQIFVGPENPATSATGNAVATGTAGGVLTPGDSMTSNGNEYTVVTGATISDQVLSVTSITRSGATATVTTAGDHGLASAVPGTIAGADQAEYNLTDTAIVVTGLDTFTYQVTGTPVSPATGTITAAFTSATVQIQSVEVGSATNLDLDTPLSLQSPIVNVDDTLTVDFGAVGGGADEEILTEYRARYLEKIRKPVAHFNNADIIAQAKTVTGVTRVFVERAGTTIGTISVTSITRVGQVATVTTASAHGFDDGQVTTIAGAAETEYNVVDARIIVESDTIFHYVVPGSPTTPATGTITSTTSIPLGQLRTFFMRDNDPDPIPTGSEVDTVRDKINEILPANTSVNDNIVAVPVAVPVAYTFTELVPNTSTMRAAVDANIAQFHDEGTVVGIDVDEDSYRAAIKNTVDPDTGDTVLSFTLSTPSGDITIDSGQIATKGVVTFP